MQIKIKIACIIYQLRFTELLKIKVSDSEKES